MQENIDEERGECEHGISPSEEKNLNNLIIQQGNFYIRERNIRRIIANILYIFWKMPSTLIISCQSL